MKVKKASKLDKYRSLLTEFLPADLPFIISNDHFYQRILDKHEHQDLEDFIQKLLTKISSSGFKYSIPYSFFIKKNEDEFRRLKLIHPLSQLVAVDFVEKFNHLICYYCSKSNFSIRAPVEVSASCYLDNPRSNNLIKENRVSVDEDKLDNKYLRSYFVYLGYDRLFKFYDSHVFSDNEKRFQFLWKIDIASFFDSIYTHSISWVIKDKQFVKENLNFDDCLGSEFDKVMQKSNYNETHGIPIGSELSRVFAEILLQRVDADLENHLLAKGYKHKIDYVIFRYVDDFFIFGNNEQVLEEIVQTLAVSLKNLNLNLNHNKTLKMKRPFLTDKSRLIYSCNKVVEKFFVEMFDFVTDSKDPKKVIVPKTYDRRLGLEFVNDIKSSCYDTGLGMNEAAGFIIGAFFRRVQGVCLQPFSEMKKVQNYEEELVIKNTSSAFLDILRLSFYFYQISPTVPNSIGLAKTVLLILNFSKEIPSVQEDVFQEIYSLSIGYLNAAVSNESHKQQLADIEILNIILLLSEVDSQFSLPQKVLNHFLKDDMDYFRIICFLYYIKNNTRFNNIKQKILLSIESKLQSLELHKTEDFMLCLDMTSCPYIDKSLRNKFLESMAKYLNFPSNGKNYDSFLTYLSDNGWFVDWNPANFYNMLERKLLKSPY